MTTLGSSVQTLGNFCRQTIALVVWVDKLYGAWDEQSEC